MTISAQAASYAKEADRRETYYGGNAAVAALKAFKRYHGDARWEVEDLDGRLRWMGQKQARVYAIVHRLSVSGERMTMTAIGQEALCSTSTVSRSVLRFQAWGMFAIDVVRGRNGGISVRLRRIGDELSSYAKAAWQRIVSAANRARINVASLLPRPVTVPTSTVVLKDATFNEAWWYEDGRCDLLDCEGINHAPLPSTPSSRAADQESARARDWAERTIVEIRRLNAGDPDWDIYLEKVRSSYGLG